MPPTPNIGNTSTAKTIIPIPPSHCSCCLYQSTACGNASIFCNTVAPVVVKPENDSKKASVVERLGLSNSIKGIAEKLASTNQKSTTIRKPSRALRSFFSLRFGYHATNPVQIHHKKPIKKGTPPPSR